MYISKGLLALLAVLFAVNTVYAEETPEATEAQPVYEDKLELFTIPDTSETILVPNYREWGLWGADTVATKVSTFLKSDDVLCNVSIPGTVPYVQEIIRDCKNTF